MSCFVCFLYAFKAVVNIVSKFVEDVEIGVVTWDMVIVSKKERGLRLQWEASFDR